MAEQFSESEVKRLRMVANITDAEAEHLAGLAPYAEELTTIAQDKIAFSRVAAKVRAWLAVIVSGVAAFILGLDNLKIFLKGLIE